MLSRILNKGTIPLSFVKLSSLELFFALYLTLRIIIGEKFILISRKMEKI